MPASDARKVRRLLPALVWFYRWLSVATRPIFAAWFASGAVMLSHPFPSLPHGAQMALQMPVDARMVAIAPGAADMVDSAEDLRLVQRAGRPAYLAGTQLYLSACTGELFQRTTRSQRLWSWTGAALGPCHPASHELERLGP